MPTTAFMHPVASGMNITNTNQKFRTPKLSQSQFSGANIGNNKIMKRRRSSQVQGVGSVAGGSLRGFWNQDDGNIKSSSYVRKKFDIEDPGLNQQLISSGTNMSQFFDPELWNYHRRVNRYFQHIFSVRQSTVLRRILKPCIILTLISAAIYGFNYVMINYAQLPHFVLSISPLVHQLLGGVLSLQLVFKTNSSYARFDEGRKLWSSLTRFSRDFIRLVSVHLSVSAMLRFAAYIKVFCTALKCELRQGQRTYKYCFKEMERTINNSLPSEEATQILSQPNVTYAVLLQIARVVKEYNPSTEDYLKKRLEVFMTEFMFILTNCERIIHTPIPLSYTRHTTRSLMVWLATLPLALYPVLNWQMIPATFIGSYLFLGIDEIGVEIEEPFCILPLTPLCKVIYNSVDQAVQTRLEMEEQEEQGEHVQQQLQKQQQQMQQPPQFMVLNGDEFANNINGFNHTSKEATP